MAYYHHYTIKFNNRITEDITIELYRKDITATEVTKLVAVSYSKKINNGDGDGFDTLNSTELEFTIFLNINSPLSYEDFLVSFHDEWKVITYVDTMLDFVGFITPGEGGSTLKGPFTISITASDNLSLIKTPLLTKLDGTDFTDKNLWIDYIVAALKKTKLDINIRTYSSVYESSMSDRGVDPFNDTFNNACLEARTFQSDAVTFVSCYDALDLMLAESYMLFQHAGKWVIQFCGELQDSIGPKNYWTEIDSDGNRVDAGQDLYEPAMVAKDQIIHMQAYDQKITAEYAIKYAKHTYNYDNWPELPKNIKFDRGTYIPGIGQDDPDEGTTQRAYTIDDWTYGAVQPGSPSTTPPHMASTADRAYRLSTYNSFGVEVEREICLENGSLPGHRMLMSEGMPVNTNGVMVISFEYKYSHSGSGTKQYAFVFLVPDAGGLPYRLENNNTTDGGKPFRWERTSALRFLSKYYDNENWDTYSSLEITTPGMPEPGTFYFCMLSYDSTNTVTYYRDLSVEYKPFIAGGYVQVKGDYWLTQQNPDYLDNITEEVKVSDSPEKIFKGALFRKNGLDLTTNTWHRVSKPHESRGFKEIVNLVRYNYAYRRMWRISGTFGGTTFHPYNDQTIQTLLCFHKHYYFPNNPRLAGKYFQLVPPLEIDYVEGRFSGVFREVLDSNLSDSDQQGDLHEFKYIFE